MGREDFLKTITELREKLASLTHFDANLNRFAQFLKVARGQDDISYRLKPLLEPDNLLTTSRLSADQQLFVAGSYFVADRFQGFEGLRKYAKYVMSVSISDRGKGREEAIQFEQATNEKRLLALGLGDKSVKK